MTRGKVWTDDDSASVRNLKMLGRTDAEIARILGFTRETIARRREMLGVRAIDSPMAREAAQVRGQLGGLASALARNKKRGGA